MPIYEYVCRDCRRRSSILVLSVRNAALTSCRHCGSAEIDRVMSRFAAPQSEHSRLESLTDPEGLGGLDEQDPEDVGDMDIEGMMEASPDEAGGMDGNDTL